MSNQQQPPPGELTANKTRRGQGLYSFAIAQDSSLKHSPGSFSGTARQLFPLRCSEESLPLHLHAWKLVEREEAWNNSKDSPANTSAILSQIQLLAGSLSQPLFSLQARERKALRLTLRFFSRRISVSWFAPGRTLINPSPPPCMEAGGEGAGMKLRQKPKWQQNKIVEVNGVATPGIKGKS